MLFHSLRLLITFKRDFIVSFLFNNSSIYSDAHGIFSPLSTFARSFEHSSIQCRARKLYKFERYKKEKRQPITEQQQELPQLYDWQVLNGAQHFYCTLIMNFCWRSRLDFAAHALTLNAECLQLAHAHTAFSVCEGVNIKCHWRLVGDSFWALLQL